MSLRPHRAPPCEAPTIPPLERFGVRVTRDVAYGTGRVGVSASRGATERTLRLDVYEPDEDAPTALRPAILMAFGGAFHRGSKEDDGFEDGGRNTPIAAWCDALARRGFAAFAIDYRLVPEDPDPGATRVVADPNDIPRSRVDVVRARMGLPPADASMLWRGVEAASDDLASAVRFVRAQAARWRVDPGRIAVGGFSAGARTALNAAFGERVGAAAVVSLSGFMADGDIRRHLGAAPSMPSSPVAPVAAPTLLVAAEHDLDYVRDGTPRMAATLAEHGVPCELRIVVGAGHFYGADAAVAAPDGRVQRLDDAVFRFLAAAVLTERDAQAGGMVSSRTHAK